MKRAFTRLLQYQDHLRVQQHHRDARDSQEALRGNLLGLPPVLHRQAKLVDTAGRIERFRRKYGIKGQTPADAPPASAPSA
jgi:hypothetical protein